jgi:hypothetical protein
MKYVTLIAVVVSALAIAACGGSEQAATVTEKETIIKESGGGGGGGGGGRGGGGQQPAEPGGSSSGTLDDYQGERLDVVEDHLKDQGIKFQEIGGGTFGVVDVTAWEVCETDPGPGAGVASGDKVELILERPGRC